MSAATAVALDAASADGIPIPTTGNPTLVFVQAGTKLNLAWSRANVIRGTGERATQLTTLANCLTWAVRAGRLEVNPIATRPSYVDPAKIRHCRDTKPRSGDALHRLANDFFEKATPRSRDHKDCSGIDRGAGPKYFFFRRHSRPDCIQFQSSGRPLPIAVRRPEISRHRLRHRADTFYRPAPPLKDLPFSNARSLSRLRFSLIMNLNRSERRV